MIVGYGTYKPEVLSRYLKDYFMPSIQPKKGEWIEIVDEETENTKTWHYECSECGKPNPCIGDNPNYCPNCGADMRGDKE